MKLAWAFEKIKLHDYLDIRFEVKYLILDIKIRFIKNWFLGFDKYLLNLKPGYQLLFYQIWCKIGLIGM